MMLRISRRTRISHPQTSKLGILIQRPRLPLMGSSPCTIPGGGPLFTASQFLGTKDSAFEGCLPFWSKKIHGGTRFLTIDSTLNVKSIISIKRSASAADGIRFMGGWGNKEEKLAAASRHCGSGSEEDQSTVDNPAQKCHEVSSFMAEKQEEDDGDSDDAAPKGKSSGGKHLGHERVLKAPARKEDRLLPFLVMKENFYHELKSRIVKDIDVSLTAFPYHLDANTRELLVDCAASHLRHPDFSDYGLGLSSSSQRVLLYAPSGGELYQETLAKAVANHLKASFLLVDSHILAPHDYGDEEANYESECESDYEDNGSNFESDLETTDEEHEGSDGDSDDPICSLLEEVTGSNYKKVNKDDQPGLADTQPNKPNDSCSAVVFKKGNRVRYIGTTKEGKDNPSSRRQALKAGQVGYIVSIPKDMSGKIGVKFLSVEKKANSLTKIESQETQVFGSLVNWCNSTELELDDGPPILAGEEWLAALEALCEIASSSGPLVIYFPDIHLWFERAVPLAHRQKFLDKLESKLDQLAGPVLLIAGHCDEREPYRKQRVHLKSRSKWKGHEVALEDVYDMFVNTINIHPPKEEEKLQAWKTQLDRDKDLHSVRKNFEKLQKALELHNMECTSFHNVLISGLHLNTAKAEKVIGWARNHYLATCGNEPVVANNGRLVIPSECMEWALLLLKDQESKEGSTSRKDYRDVAEDEYESSLLSAVIPSKEIGVLFDDIGALEDVKKALKELVILPLQRPELFSKGTLTRPCRGVLLFGPPGTGKTLLAKAIATEAGANFISVTSSTVTSKWFGDAEKLIKSLFSLARKLSPSVIFVDEVDSLLGARGSFSEHEATRRTRNEFMAAWDGLRTKDQERVLVLGATNRPFDLDDAVIRRLPRRILVDLPDAINRSKILRTILSKEDLEHGFDFDEVARITEGYSGSDLKNLSVAAAYRPIREYLSREAELEVKECATDRSAEVCLRPLTINDFQQAMSQVGASVSYDASSMNELRHWNEKYGEGGSRKTKKFGFAI